MVAACGPRRMVQNHFRFQVSLWIYLTSNFNLNCLTCQWALCTAFLRLLRPAAFRRLRLKKRRGSIALIEALSSSAISITLSSTICPIKCSRNQTQQLQQYAKKFILPNLQKEEEASTQQRTLRCSQHVGQLDRRAW
jgi:hypothetical protein